MSRVISKTEADEPLLSSAPRRGGKQARSLQRRNRIAKGTIKVLAAHGVAGLTHRLVAKAAGVSLAATTYYFDTKFDMIAEAASVTLRTFSDAFQRVADRAAADPEKRLTLGETVCWIVRNVAERERTLSMSWAEIVLDARHHPETLQLARTSFKQLIGVWSNIARFSGEKRPEQSARSAVDVMIGLLMITLGLGLTARQVNKVLTGGANPLTAWRVPAQTNNQISPARPTRKSQATRDRIVAAAIEIIMEEGPAAVNYRSVAAAANIATSGPYYHFPAIASLLAAAQQRLFEESKERYRSITAGSGNAILDLDQFVDRLAEAFVREATEFAGRDMASYAVWLQAARQPELRPMIWSAVENRYRAWKGVLDRLSRNFRTIDPLLAQALFIGKLIRVLATGSSAADLRRAQGDFANDLRDMLEGKFWL